MKRAARFCIATFLLWLCLAFPVVGGWAYWGFADFYLGSDKWLGPSIVLWIMIHAVLGYGVPWLPQLSWRVRSLTRLSAVAVSPPTIFILLSAPLPVWLRFFSVLYVLVLLAVVSKIVHGWIFGLVREVPGQSGGEPKTWPIKGRAKWYTLLALPASAYLLVSTETIRVVLGVPEKDLLPFFTYGVVVFVAVAVLSLIELWERTEKWVWRLFPVGICAVTLIVAGSLTFGSFGKKLAFQVDSEKRMEIVEMIKAGKLKAEREANVALPSGYIYLSCGGHVRVDLDRRTHVFFTTRSHDWGQDLEGYLYASDNDPESTMTMQRDMRYVQVAPSWWWVELP